MTATVTLASAAVFAVFALIVGILFGLWLGEKVDPAPPEPDSIDIDWDNAA